MSKRNFCRSLATFCTVIAFGVASVSHAALSVSSVNGGGALVDPSVQYINFDSGTGPFGILGNQVKVSNTTDAAFVTGQAATYAPPFLSGDNGKNFGAPDQALGADATQYITTGSTGSFAAAQSTLTFDIPQRYFGILWGSVDDYNKLVFYDASDVKIGEINGIDVKNPASGNQQAVGTMYVNVFSDLPYSKVVATSSQYAFEFDNVAYSQIPEAGSLSIWAVMGLVASLRFRRGSK